MSPLPNVEIVNRQGDLGHIHVDSIPQELLDWAEGNGYNVALSATQLVGFLQGMGRQVLLYSEIPEDLRLVMRKHGFSAPERSDGEIRKFDCVITVQANAERDRFREAAENRRVQQEDESFEQMPEYLEEMIASRTRELTGRKNRFVHVQPKEGASGGARSHVVGGAAIAEQVRKEMERDEETSRAAKKK